MLTSGYYVVPEDDGGSTLHFVVQADPKASKGAVCIYRQHQNSMIITGEIHQRIDIIMGM